MSKSKILTMQIIGCVVLGTVIGLGWWLSDGGKTGKKVSDCPGGLPIDNDKAIKVYYGRWHKNYLEIIGR